MSFLDDAIAQIQSAKASLLNAQNECDAAISILLNPPPPPPPQLVDCLQLIVPTAQACRWVTQHNFAAPDSRVGFYFPKTSGGFPYDIKIMDANGLREHSTENDKIAWTDVAAKSAWKSYDAPLYFLPRVYDPSQGEIILSDLADLPWTRYWTCSTHDAQSHLGAARTTFVGPLTDRNWGGIIGNSAYFVTHYYYKGNPTTGFTTRENFYWGNPFGWFGWEIQTGNSLTNMWNTPSNSSIHNTAVGTQPTPQDPCGIISMKFF